MLISDIVVTGRANMAPLTASSSASSAERKRDECEMQLDARMDGTDYIHRSQCQQANDVFAYSKQLSCRRETARQLHVFSESAALCIASYADAL